MRGIGAARRIGTRPMRAWRSRSRPRTPRVVATYGSPRIHEDLRAQGPPRVAQARRPVDAGAGAARPPRRRQPRTTDSQHALPIAENVLNRAFDVATPNTVWAGDITYLATREGWVYLAVILDLWSRRVVGYAMSDEPSRRRGPDGAAPGPGSSADARGAHASFGSREPVRQPRLSRAPGAEGIACSMSRRGNCWDNAVVESFFGTLKTELAETAWPTRAAASAAVTDYIDVFYNRRRRHSSLGYLSPVEFELQQARCHAAA